MHCTIHTAGTLTRNVMDFRKASICGVRYGQGITEIGKASWKLQGKSRESAGTVKYCSCCYKEHTTYLR